ncbi:MAG: type 4a pilus biogenesis protein PilO [Nitrospira sp.]|nr:type 4a pilus biogenesis protein PilO [Nitrospira sp.]
MAAINLNTIKNIPFHFQVIIAALPPLILIVAFVFLIYIPKDKEIKELNVQLTELNAEIAEGEEKVKRLDELIAENKILKERLAELRKQLPEEKEVSVLLKQISELGLKSGLNIILWKPEPRKTDPEGLYVEIPVKVEVMTDYHQLGAFFSHISRLQRLVNISDIKLDVNTDSEGDAQIYAKFMARTFASVSPEEQAAIAAAAAAAAKK